MKYTATINLAGIHDAGLSDKTDLADWVIIDYVKDICSYKSATLRDGKASLNYREIMACIPLLGIKSKSSISSRIRNLEDLGLIEIDKADNGRIFAKPSRSALEIIRKVEAEVTL